MRTARAWQPFDMAWTCASTSTNTSCWRSQVMDKHYRPRHSAKHFILMLLGLDTFIVNLILKYILLRTNMYLIIFLKICSINFRFSRKMTLKYLKHRMPSHVRGCPTAGLIWMHIFNSPFPSPTFPFTPSTTTNIISTHVIKYLHVTLSCFAVRNYSRSMCIS